MAAKLILSVDGVPIKEFPLTKERVTIGRKSTTDIVIDNLGVSGEHAAVITILQDSFLEDLNSTNGLSVNGEPTKKHFLQNNDEIEIGKHTLKYVTDQVSQTTAEDFEKTMVLRGPVKLVTPVVDVVEHAAELMQTHVLNATGASKLAAEITDKLPATLSSASAAPQVTPSAAAVQILTGPNAGKELELLKSLTTLGKPGVQVAVLARRPSGYFITYVEGDSFPSVNGHLLNEQPRQLNDHDVIELAGVKMEFFLKA
ncbi:MAG: FHA domain-containing protein [Gallionella sp.]